MIVLEAMAEFNNTQNSENFLNVTKLPPEWQMLEILFQHLYLVTVCDSCAFVLFYGNFIECSECSIVVQPNAQLKYKNTRSSLMCAGFTKLNTCNLCVNFVIFCFFKKILECV